MKKFGRWLKKIFLPPEDASMAIRLLPFGLIIIAIIAVILFATGACRITSYNVCYTKLLRG